MCGFGKQSSMTQEQEAMLLKEVHENNIMLRSIVRYINEQLIVKDQKDFSLNLFANILGNKID